jgi:HPt (histidine-containing phosphotransfer) domain-containing protein
LLDSFHESAVRLLAEMSQALAVGDRETLHRAAHTLKSTAAAIGALRLSGLARDLEAGTRETSWACEPASAEASALLTEAEAEYEKVKAALTECEPLYTTLDAR